jgi:hypothetical protein
MFLYLSRERRFLKIKLRQEAINVGDITPGIPKYPIYKLIYVV